MAFAESLYVATMLPLLTALGLGDDERIRKRFARGYRRDCSKIARVPAGDVGWIQLSQSAAEFHLDQLHLVPEWRGRGIGTYLIRAILRRARMAGLAVALDVIRGNPAIELYRRLGFQTSKEDEEKYKMIWRPPPNL